MAVSYQGDTEITSILEPSAVGKRLAIQILSLNITEVISRDVLILEDIFWRFSPLLHDREE